MISKRQLEEDESKLKKTSSENISNESEEPKNDDDSTSEPEVDRKDEKPIETKDEKESENEKTEEVSGKAQENVANANTPKKAVFGSSFKLPSFGSLQTKPIDELIKETDHTDKNKEEEKKYEEQNVLTGEEQESTIVSIKGKLFTLIENDWKEKGIGLLKLNRDKKNENNCRLLMRTEGVHKLILNTKLFKDFCFEVVQKKNIRFGVIEDKKPISYLFRGKNEEEVQNASKEIKKVIENLCKEK